ncbi:MAG: hypothetical protein Q8P28_04380 [Deltaproteobacteria bacterium]|nr:hypothetical protein [Deltaproteobacteria bacterium]
MAKLTIYKPDGWSRKDKSTEHAFLDEEPVDLFLYYEKTGLRIRFCLSGRAATSWGELYLSDTQVEQLKEDINSHLKKYEPDTKIL